VIAISHASRKLLIKHGVCAHKIAVIRIGTPAPIKRKITKVKGLLVCIAAFGPAKGAHRVFDLVTQHRGISRIYIAGSGGHTDYKFYLHELKRESKIPTIIEYEPDDKRVSSLLQMAEYVAVLEQWENPGPLIIGEAINSGAKVLWVDRGGIRECVEKVVSMDEMKEALRCLYLTVSQA
jgi:glycosyltransferase involved in cell wall biosynthesis